MTSGWSAAWVRSMIDSRRCARHTAVVGSTISRTPQASGPAVAEAVDHRVHDDLAVGLLVAPCHSAHGSALREREVVVRGRRRPRGRGAAGELVVDRDVALAAGASRRARAPRARGPGGPSRSGAPRRRRARRSSGRSRPTSFGSAYTAASPAETRVSRRSKATTGRPKAMYSMVLFIVETSLSGFFGSGHSPTVGGREDVRDGLVGHPPGELDVVLQAEPVALGDQVVVAVAGAHQREGDVRRAPSRGRSRRPRRAPGRRRPAGPSRRGRPRGARGRGAAPGPRAPG